MRARISPTGPRRKLGLVISSFLCLPNHEMEGASQKIADDQTDRSHYRDNNADRARGEGFCKLDR